MLLATTATTAWAENESTLTVCDGTDHNAYIPIHKNAYSYIRTEFVLPKEMLSSMKNGIIKALTFYYYKQYSFNFNKKFHIYMKEINNSTLNAYTYNTDAEVVYYGEIELKNRMIHITLNNSYHYKGGNLLIGIYNSDKASNISEPFYFYGLNSSGASISGANTDDPQNITGKQQNFLPKTTFTYEDPYGDNYSDFTYNFGSSFANIKIDGQLWRTNEAQALTATSTTNNFTIPDGGNLTKKEGENDDYNFTPGDATSVSLALDLTSNEDITYSEEPIKSAINIVANELMTVTTKVGEAEAQTATITDGKISDVAYGTVITAQANDGYIFSSFSAKKGEADLDVILNDDRTQATFTMIEEEVNVAYEIARDMKKSVTATLDNVILGESNKVLIKKEDNSNYTAITPTIVVKDVLNNANTTLTEGTQYELTITNSDNNVVEKFTEPGEYTISILGKGGYNGSLTYTVNVIESYEVTIPAGEFITYYRDDANMTLEAEESDVKLYTITDIDLSNAQATATELTVVGSETPMLVYNSSEADKTIRLIKTDAEATSATVDNCFKGTMTAKTFEDTTTKDYFACTGKAFAKVNTDGTIAAHRCWLEIAAAGTRSLTVVFDENPTGIDALNSDKLDSNGDWYDLLGRKLQGKPTQKGLFIKNGKKVVIK